MYCSLPEGLVFSRSGSLAYWPTSLLATVAYRRVALLGDEHEIELSTPRGLDRVGLAHHAQLRRAGTSGRSVQPTGQALRYTGHALEVACRPGRGYTHQHVTEPPASTRTG